MNAELIPTRAAALACIAAVRPAEYAKSRNAIDGAVTGLSPYITHGLVTLPEVLAGVASKHRLDVQHKFVFELGWREYFRHVWAHRGDGILSSLHRGPLPDDAYARALPDDIRHARTGVPAIDMAVRTLYNTGMMHNHARMWLASYVVHLRKVHWRSGADWLYAHLLDGDLASNHLSWQWVAGTGSSKPYLFNADNVARYAPADWHSGGSVVDQSYDALDALARRRQAVAAGSGGEGVNEPALLRQPPLPWLRTTPCAADVAGQDVWLVHPWALREPPPAKAAGCLRLGLLLSDFHEMWPWSPARWAFVGACMSELAPNCWCGSRAEVALALAGARSVQTWVDPHIDPLLSANVTRLAPPSLFANMERPCPSFSKWWTQAIRGVKSLSELPGLATWVSEEAAGPLFAQTEPT